jgi:hypothetical protein
VIHIALVNTKDDKNPWKSKKHAKFYLFLIYPVSHVVSKANWQQYIVIEQERL